MANLAGQLCSSFWPTMLHSSLKVSFQKWETQFRVTCNVLHTEILCLIISTGLCDIYYPSLSFFIITFTVLLEYSWFTMIRKFQMYSKVNLIYICIYIYIHIYMYVYPLFSYRFFSHIGIAKYWVEFPVP